MRTIICKKCGQPIDAALGECPFCGAVYYILPREDETGDETRVWDEAAEKIHAAIEKEELDPVKLEEEPTRAIPVPPAAPVPAEAAAPEPAKAPGGEHTKAPVSGPVRRPAPRSGRKPPSRTWMFAVMAAALLAVLTLVLCFMTGVFDFGASSQVMPDVVGLNRDVAVDQLKAMNIKSNVIYEESTEPADTVIRQSPEQGKSVSRSTRVTLTVSSGTAASPAPETEYVEVPEVMGLRYETAVSRLESLGLRAVRGGEEYSETAEAGTVTRQSPLSGAKMEPGGIVTLTVSKGPEEKEFSVVITAGKGGSVSPSGTVTVAEGQDLTITVTPDEGYALQELRIDGQSVGVETEYTLKAVQDDHSVYAVFAAVQEPETPSPSPEEPEQTPVIPIGPSTPTDLPAEP